MGTRTKFSSNQVFNLFHEKVKLPGGGWINDFLVVSPKFRSKTGLTGVAILPILIERGTNGKRTKKTVILVEIFRPPVKTVHFEVPRGFIDKNETARQACVRELKEEIGRDLKILSIKKIKEVFPEPGVLDGRVAVFVAEIERASFDASFIANEAGHRSLVEFSNKKLIAALNGGKKIRDLMSCYCVERYLSNAK
jgi:ADP-ribose pyrophosphatase YjhB (NUDIX family)